MVVSGRGWTYIGNVCAKPAWFWSRVRSGAQIYACHFFGHVSGKIIMRPHRNRSQVRRVGLCTLGGPCDKFTDRSDPHPDLWGSHVRYSGLHPERCAERLRGITRCAPTKVLLLDNFRADRTKLFASNPAGQGFFLTARRPRPEGRITRRGGSKDAGGEECEERRGPSARQAGRQPISAGITADRNQN